MCFVGTDERRQNWDANRNSKMLTWRAGGGQKKHYCQSKQGHGWGCLEVEQWLLERVYKTKM